jgi:hypothetical protein
VRTAKVALFAVALAEEVEVGVVVVGVEVVGEGVEAYGVCGRGVYAEV